MQPRTTAPLIGITIDQRFKILAAIGAGASGSLYKAQDLERNYCVALKFLKENVDARSQDRFKRGVDLATGLTHPNIVRLFSYHTTADRPYLVMDCVDGKNLADLLAETPRLDEDMCIQIFAQICDALEHAHSKGLVHRNLKPSNIMLISGPGQSYVVKLADFGLAKTAGDKETRQSLAKKGEMLGNPSYMSPEQCNGKKIDGRSDIYAAGCLLFECLTGGPPYTATNSFEVMSKHVQGPIPDVNAVRQDLKYGKQIQAILARAMAKDVKQRYYRAADMSSDLSLIKEATAEDWQARAVAMKPPEEAEPLVSTAAVVPASLPIKPILIAVGITCSVMLLPVIVMLGIAMADLDVPVLGKYKILVQEALWQPNDPRLLKNLNAMTEYYKGQGKYAEAWAYKNKLLKATQPSIDEKTPAISTKAPANDEPATSTKVPAFGEPATSDTIPPMRAPGDEKAK